MKSFHPNNPLLNLIFIFKILSFFIESTDPCFETQTFSSGRKAYLLEDKQIPSVGVFDEVFLALGWNLEEIHMTWADLEKKQTRLRTYTKSLEEMCSQSVETASTENPIRTLGDYSKPSHKGYRNTIELPIGMNVTNHRPSAGGKLRDRNAKESWALLEDLALYDNKSWNEPRDFAKLVKAISSPQDVPSTFDRWLIELKNQVKRLMEAHIAHMQHIQVNKITSSCEICSVSHDTQYYMENPKQTFVDYASSRTNEAGDARISEFEADFKQQQSEMTNKIDTVLKAITDRIASTLPSDTVKKPKLVTHPVSSARSYPIMDPQCSTQIHSSVNAITIHPKQQSDSHDRTKENEEEERGSPENHPDSPTPPDLSISFITEKVLKFNSLFKSLG
ncbi:hypothetical protein Tco_1373457, partial [Tanacetum coccineum]